MIMYNKASSSYLWLFEPLAETLAAVHAEQDEQERTQEIQGGVAKNSRTFYSNYHIYIALC